MTDVSFIADFEVGEAWFNQSLTKFAIVPNCDDVAPEAIAAAVDTLVDAYKKTGETRQDSDAKNEIIAELLDLHARGLILWPLGTTFDQSALGYLSTRRLFASVSEEDPCFAELREKCDGSASFSKICATADPERASAMSFSFWRIFMTLRLATVAPGMQAYHEIKETQLFTLVDALRADGVYHPWVTEIFRADLKKFRALLAIEREDPEFGAALLNRKRSQTAAAQARAVPHHSPHLIWLMSATEKWMDTRMTLTRDSARRAQTMLLLFFRDLPVARTTPENAFKRDNVKALLRFAANWSSPTLRGLAVSRVREFAEWYYHEFTIDEYPASSCGITESDVVRFLKENRPVGSKRGDVLARPMPMRLQRRLIEIISENDFAWPKSLIDRGTGLPTHYCLWRNPITDEIRSVFCEVLPRMLMLQLELPLRNVQVRRLDSGEGDDRQLDAATMSWREAEGVHAGYWKRNGALNPRRGVFREILSTAGALTGFWVNSNKTQDAAVAFDETSGYEIPWQHEEVLKNLSAMRDWQETYNPVDGPLPSAVVPRHVFGEEPAEGVRPRLPDRFYLFRYPLNSWARGNEGPPTYGTFTRFFYEALEELQRRLAAEEPESAVKIITHYDPVGRPYKAIFTPHGTRSALLTSLFSGGAPIGVLSKFVAGHATILMTLRYTKFDPAHINEVLSDARTKSMDEARGQFANFLKSATLQEAMRMTARLSDDGLHQSKNGYQEATAWADQEIGICVNGATLCSIGGEEIKKGVYAPVPGGARNCVRCRFFLTGYGYIGPMYMRALIGFARIDAINAKITALEADVKSAKSERMAFEGAVPASVQHRIRVLEETYFTQCEARDQTVVDTEAAAVYVEKLRVIGDLRRSEADPKIPMLAADEESLKISIRESTRFELIDALNQVARFYPSLAPEDLEAEYHGFVDRALWKSGFTPLTLSPLSLDERREAARAFSEMFLIRLGAAEAEHLFEGQKTIADLGLQGVLEMAVRKAIGRPFELSGDRISHGIRGDGAMKVVAVKRPVVRRSGRSSKPSARTPATGDLAADNSAEKMGW